MKTVTESVNFKYSATVIWEIISDITRSDWLPTVNKISLKMIAEFLKWREWDQLQKRF